MLIILMGLRGSGKSTIGAILARRLRTDFIDLDHRVKRALACATIRQAWLARGEPAFREAELACLRRVLSQTRDGVLSLGGGTPTIPGARALLRAARASRDHALVYLRCQPATLRGRLAALNADDRPALTPAGTIPEVEAVFAQRDPVYTGVAGTVIEADALSPDAVVERVLRAL